MYLRVTSIGTFFFFTTSVKEINSSSKTLRANQKFFCKAERRPFFFFDTTDVKTLKNKLPFTETDDTRRFLLLVEESQVESLMSLNIPIIIIEGWRSTYGGVTVKFEKLVGITLRFNWGEMLISNWRTFLFRRAILPLLRI